jgi:hypothetical protein
MVEKLPNDLEGMQSSMEKLYVLIDEIYKYVNDVVVRIFPFRLDHDVKFIFCITVGGTCGT